jgi:hypothetical protein
LSTYYQSVSGWREVSDPEQVIVAYNLSPDALDALKCVSTMENLTRRIRYALRGEKGAEHGVPSAERLIVVAAQIMRREIKDRWSLNGAQPVTIPDEVDEPQEVVESEAPKSTDPFSNW